MRDRPAEAASSELAAQATAVLRRNDLGGWTKTAPTLYPHQWIIDSAFIAIGRAHLDTRRAARELRTLYTAQWANGMVPHILFNPEAPSYFPDARFWASDLSPDAPATPRTSGLCQPPFDTIAVRHIWDTAERAGGDAAAEARLFLEEMYPRLLAWHRFLASARDPEGSGLITVYHPWETATDNSPRWHDALMAVPVGDLAPYTRHDLTVVTDPSQRPTMAEYDRYLWLVELMKRVRYNAAAIERSLPFAVKDVLFSAVFVAANEALLAIGEVVGAPDADRRLIADWRDRGRRGLEQRWDPELGLCLDYDLRAGKPVRVRTFAGFASLVAGELAPERQAAVLTTLDSPAFLGEPRLRWPLPPSTSPQDPAFQPRGYLRGPTWSVYSWLFWWGLLRAGETDRAARLRRAALEQVATSGFAEYFEPFTGEPLGSPEQSMVAAVTLDWLAHEPGGDV